jgi:flagellin-like protein
VRTKYTSAGYSQVLRRSRRAVSPILSQVLLVAMVIILSSILFAFRPPVPTQPSHLYYTVIGGQTEPAWGDGSDCNKNTGTCTSLSTTDLVLTTTSPTGLLLNSLIFYLLCNGTVYLTASFAAMELVPGATSPPGPSAPQLGKCGTYVPPAAAFNRLAYFHQLVPGSAALTNGDYLVIYGPNPGDEDFHGAPAWCYTVQGACTIQLAFLGPPSVSLVQIPLYGLPQP